MAELKIKLTSLLLAGSMGLTACTTVPSLPAPQTKLVDRGGNKAEFFSDSDGATVTPNPSEVRPGFLLAVRSKLDRKLNVEARVSHAGEIELPYDVKVKAAGQTLGKLTAELRRAYSRYFKSTPDIQVEIIERKYYVEASGVVQKPGIVLVANDEKVEDIMKKSGDMNLDSEARFLRLVRGDREFVLDLQDYFRQGAKRAKTAWRGGEQLQFLKSSAISENDSKSLQLLGDVRAPGVLAYKDGADFFYYFGKTGGSTATTDFDRIRVIRPTDKGPAETNGSAQDIARYLKLEPGDMILVGSSAPTKYERNLQLTTTIATVLSTIGILLVVKK